LLSVAARRLTDAGVPSPRVDAELLLAHCAGVERARLPLLAEVPQPAVASFEESVRRRALREPLQHITGTAPFRHLVLAVGPGVFVPRPETELLVGAALPALRATPAPLVVDLCAGSGALALSVAHEVPGARVYAVENAPSALAWLDRNAGGTTVTVLAADVSDPAPLAALRGRADVVLSNPPYVPMGTAVDPEVRADPAEAVFAADGGLALMPAVVARAAELLRRGGTLALEHDDTHAGALPALLHRDGRWHEITAHRDLSGRARFVTARRC
jgi:release factor glutamine methyltransferase